MSQALDYDLFEREAAAHFVELRKERGPAAIAEVGHALRQHAVATQPSWPSEDERARDLADHLELLAIFDRVQPRR